MQIDINEPLIRVECVECNHTFFPVNFSGDEVLYCVHCGSDEIETYEEEELDD